MEYPEANRRTVLKMAGGIAGISAVTGVSTVENSAAQGNRANDPALQQQTEGERVGMVTAGNRQIFTAPVLWIAPETTVTWVIESGSHSSTAYAQANDKPGRIPEDAEAWDSGVLSEQGATFEKTFGVEGVYDYYCTPHEALGMVGRLVVGAPDLANEPALAEPQDALPAPVQEIISGFNTLTQSMFGSGDGQ